MLRSRNQPLHLCRGRTNPQAKATNQQALLIREKMKFSDDLGQSLRSMGTLLRS